jgi:hypothetical protein
MAAMDGFSRMLIKMEKGEGVSFVVETKETEAVVLVETTAIADIQVVDMEEEVEEEEEEDDEM